MHPQSLQLTSKTLQISDPGLKHHFSFHALKGWTLSIEKNIFEVCWIATWEKYRRSRNPCRAFLSMGRKNWYIGTMIEIIKKLVFWKIQEVTYCKQKITRLIRQWLFLLKHMFLDFVVKIVMQFEIKNIWRDRVKIQKKKIFLKIFLRYVEVLLCV